MLKIFSASDVRSLLPYETLIPAIREAMIAVSKGETALPLRTAPDLGPIGRIGMMPGSWSSMGLATVKLTAFPATPSVDSHSGILAVFSGEHLQPLALLSANEVTARRTAAASAVATDALARADASSLAIIGAGTQAVTHLEALSHVRSLRDVRIWGRNQEKAKRVAGDAPNARAVATVEEATDGANIICTVTSAQEPVLSASLVHAGAHLNLVGSSSLAFREVSDDVIGLGRLFVDYRASAEDQAVELRGEYGLRDVVAEIGEVLAGAPGRKSQDEVTIYKSLGVAAQDIAAARLALQNAIKISERKTVSF